MWRGCTGLTETKTKSVTFRLTALLLAGTMLGSLVAVPAQADDQSTDAPAAPSAAAPVLPPEPVNSPVAPVKTVLSLTVEGAQRLEADTVLSYTKLRVGSTYTREALDEALKDLYASELFQKVEIRDPNNAGNLTIVVQENPVINRIVLEGNKRLKEDKIRPEIKMAPRQIYTRSKVRADVARIIELYRRQGRFAAVVDPKLVKLDQNRVDIVYEISEGPKSKVRQINIIGNMVFPDGQLRGEMATKQGRWFRLFSSGTTYDPDRLAYDQQKLRQFYLTNGYADFRVVSAVAELTSNKQDFINLCDRGRRPLQVRRRRGEERPARSLLRGPDALAAHSQGRLVQCQGRGGHGRAAQPDGRSVRLCLCRCRAGFQWEEQG